MQNPPPYLPYPPHSLLSPPEPYLHHHHYAEPPFIYYSCCAVLLEPQLLDIMIVQFRNEKLVIMALYRSPLTVTLWPSSFLKKDSTSP
ncbi:hypothetical protein TNCV_5065901 [Trichonephila clavipes]|nr:hypothetical protein TNCV_5065901 [Trichonephila clavipes]